MYRMQWACMVALGGSSQYAPIVPPGDAVRRDRGRVAKLLSASNPVSGGIRADLGHGTAQSSGGLGQPECVVGEL